LVLTKVTLLLILIYYSGKRCLDKIVCILFVFNVLIVSVFLSLYSVCMYFYCINCCFCIVFVYCSVTNLGLWLQETKKVHLITYDIMFAACYVTRCTKQSNGASQTPPRHPFHDRLVQPNTCRCKTGRNQHQTVGALACAGRRSGVATGVSTCFHGPFTWRNLISSTKPKVRNVSQPYQRMTETRPSATCKEIW